MDLKIMDFPFTIFIQLPISMQMENYLRFAGGEKKVQ